MRMDRRPTSVNAIVLLEYSETSRWHASGREMKLCGRKIGQHSNEARCCMSHSKQVDWLQTMTSPRQPRKRHGECRKQILMVSIRVVGWVEYSCNDNWHRLAFALGPKGEKKKRLAGPTDERMIDTLEYHVCSSDSLIGDPLNEWDITPCMPWVKGFLCRRFPMEDTYQLWKKQDEGRIMDADGRGKPKANGSEVLILVR